MESKRLLGQHDKTYQYWTDGEKVFFNAFEIKGMDIETFEQYPGSWGKDKNHCYCTSTRLQGVDVKSFSVLNFTYAKDNMNVWTLGGKIKDVDAKTFEVCDNGKRSLGKTHDKQTGLWYELFVPYGFGKDKNNVYYYDYSGKPNIVKNASPKTFISLDDNYFGYDENSVFCGRSKLQKSDPKTWKKFKDLYYYSKDKKIIYYFNRIIKEADAETFEVLEQNIERGLPKQLAKDKNNYYWNDSKKTKEEIDKMLKK
jgi:hypothetical protein